MDAPEATNIEAARHWFTVQGADRVRCTNRTGSVRKLCASLEEAQAFFEALDKGCASTNEIVQFMHCAECLEQKPVGVSPREWAQLEVGWTPVGIQVWCRRHEVNVCHIDFEGKKHPANCKAQPPDKPNDVVGLAE